MRWRAVGAFAAVAVLGAVVGHVAGGAHEPPATRSVHVGAMTLGLTGGWRRVDATTLSNGLQSMRVTLGPAAGPSLAPDGVTAVGKPRAARLGGYRAWAYGDTTVLPTTRGVIAVECACAGAIRSVSVAGAAVLTPAPDLALRLRAPAVLAKLDAVRVEQRSPWTPASAARLATAHRQALAALDPLATPALARALADAEHAYDALAAAPSGSQADVAASDRELEAAVASLARAGQPRVQRTAAPARGGGSLITVLLVAAAALLFGALGLAAVRRLSRRPEAPPADEPPETVPLPTPRKPITPPPPTYGRWNEAPRGPGAAPEEGAQRPTETSSAGEAEQSASKPGHLTDGAYSL